MNFKKLFIGLPLLLTVAAAAEGEYKFSKSPVSPRIIKTDASKSQLLFKNGKAEFQIVCGPTRVARFAAEELASRLSQALGVKLTVSTKRTGTLPALIVGDMEAAKKAGMDPAKLDRDGFFIRTVGKDIYLAGQDDPRANPESHSYFQRASLFAVYDFLERFAGVRYYFPGIGVIVPKLKEWRVPQIDITERPDSQNRQVYAVFGGTPNQAGQYLYGEYKNDWRKHYRDREYQLRLLTRPIATGHGLAYLGLIERFAKTHPEYFALSEKGKRLNGTDVVRSPCDRRGQICFSQPGLKEEIVKDGIALLSGKGAASRGALDAKGHAFATLRPDQRPFFDIMPNDCCAPCRCPGCAPYSAQYGKQKYSDFIWHWMIDVAKRIQKSGVEGFVSTMCYDPFHLMPPEPLPSNMIVRLALFGAWVNDAQFKKDMAYLKAWYEKSNSRVALWIYMINCGTRGHQEVPHFTPAAMGKFMKAVAKYSFGTFMECENVNYLANYLSYYVFSRVTWDEKTDVDKLLDEHDKLMFGPAAATMKKIRERWEYNWLKRIVGNVVETPLGPVSVSPSKTELWEKIYNQKELAFISSLFDKAEKESAKDRDALARVKFIRKQIWQHTLDESASFWKQFDDRREWKGFMPERKGEIRIDGKLDEEAWKKAPVYWMVPRKIASQKIPDAVEVYTKVRMLYDKDYFYFGFECDEPHTGKLSHQKRKFDDGNMWMDNLVEIFLSPNQKSSLIYQFMVTSANGNCDLRTYQGSTTDYKWNSGMVSQVSVTPGKAWFAEVRIPRKSMPGLTGNEIAGNFTRGRVLNDNSVKVQVPYYTWSPAFVRQTPENCGRILLSEVVNNSIIADGGFAISLFWTKKGYFSPWSHNVLCDYKDFRTNGAAAELSAKHYSLSQNLPKAKPDTLYRLSFYMKLDHVKKTAKDGGLLVRMGNYYPFREREHGNFSWRRFQFEHRTPKKLPSNYNLWFHFKNATGRALIDQVEMVEIPDKK